MKVFVAGGSGTIGFPLVRALVEAGHQVTALTRSMSKRDALCAAGASVAVADALDRSALIAVVKGARPTHVIHQLTALPKGGPRRPSDLDATNRLRIDGTRHLLDAALLAGARRFVLGSFAAVPARGLAAEAADDAASAAIREMEHQVLEATAAGVLDGVILRYGIFYGLATPSTAAMIALVRKRRLPVVNGDKGQLPFIHIDDAVSATVRALDRAPIGTAYNIVDDRAVSLTELVETLAEYTRSAPPRHVPAWLPPLVSPYMARLIALRLSLSNAKARTELGWRPKYSTMRDGLRQVVREEA
jgi:nucleoside-diphosphate-sugar epimerase